jgi:glucokinase
MGNTANANGPEHVIGVDLGGTKIMAGVFDRTTACVAHSKTKTKGHKGPEHVIERIVECVREAVEQASVPLSQIGAIGIGAPGSVDAKAGRVVFAPNLNWRDVDLAGEIEQRLGVPVFLENDCNICTLGVHTVELSGKPKHLVGIFLGTGIGCGLIVHGRLYSGFKGSAGEIGHMVLDVDGPECGCGNRGCFEALASRTAIFNRIVAGIKSGRKTLIREMLKDDVQNHRSGKLRKAIAAGDEFVAEVVRDAAYYTGIAVANIVNLLNPEYVVLGGGLMEQLEDEIMGVILETARKFSMRGALEGVSIQPTKLADDAGIAGGAVLARAAIAGCSTAVST